MQKIGAPGEIAGEQRPMFEIVACEDLSGATYLIEVYHRMMAKAVRPGQFVIVMSREHGDR